MAKVVTVMSQSRRPLRLAEMSFIRWARMSEALARLGHDVHFATNAMRYWPGGKGYVPKDGVGLVPLDGLSWEKYDVVKTLFHEGFGALSARGGATHRFIIAKLGSVVGSAEVPGVHFHGTVREQLHETQCAISRAARYVTVLTREAGELWQSCHGTAANLLVVPGAADAVIPDPGRDPYPANHRPRVLFAGNIYRRADQPEANRELSRKLNALGERLAARGIALYFLGTGDTRNIDRRVVTLIGSRSIDESWDYMRNATVGIVVSAGAFMHNNESTKIYHYLRAGTPVISEAGFPNDGVVTQSGLGEVVPNGDMEFMAQRIAAAVDGDWNRDAGVDFILSNHTWDHRAAVYDRVIRFCVA